MGAADWRSEWPFESLQVDVRCTNKVARANIFLAHEERELLGRTANDFVAEIHELFPHARVVQRGDRSGIELGDDLRRRLCRHQKGRPCPEAESGNARFR